MAGGPAEIPTLPAAPDGAAAAGFTVWGMEGGIAVTEPRCLPVARAALDAELSAMGAACDRFDPSSELSRLNAAAGRPAEVSPLFAEVLEEALRVAEATDGTVDPTVGTALVAAGYDRDLDEVRSRAALPYIRPVPAAGWRQVELADGVVHIPPGTVLDLGATAKALTVDRAAARAAREAGCAVLVGLGGDLAVGGHPPADGWQVRVAEDHRAGPDADAQVITIADGGLATSSVTVRRWTRGGRPMHHLIDPATGSPVDPYWRTVTVAAATCVDANAAATSAIVRGPGADSWLAAAHLPARLIGRSGDPVTVAGWPAAEPAEARA